MGQARGKRTINTWKPDCPPLKRKRRKVTEVMSSGSQADDLQQRVIGQKKSRRGGVAMLESVMVEGQTLSQAEVCKTFCDVYNNIINNHNQLLNV